jgi:hypothetical protein
MIQRRSLIFLLCVVAACVVAQPGSAAQKPVTPPIQIEVISVTASNSTRGMDPQLEKIPWSRTLRSLFAYQSYQMDSRSRQQTVCGRMLSFNLPGGIILHVAPIRIDGQRINLIIDMFDAQRPQMMNMHAELPNQATLILGGPHYAPGMMIVLLNVGIVGALHPAPPQPRLPAPRAPRIQPSPGNTAPELVPTAPMNPGEVSPISTQP